MKSIRGVTRDIGCSYPAAQGWIKHGRTPSEDYKTEIANVYEIPVDAWDLPADGKKPSSRVSLPPPSPSEPEPVLQAVEKPKARKRPRKPGISTSTLEDARRMLHDIDKDCARPNLTAPSLSKLRRERVQVLNLISRLEKENELLEDRVVDQHPRWLALKGAILRALKPYPEAAEAVLRELADA